MPRSGSVAPSPIGFGCYSTLLGPTGRAWVSCVKRISNELLLGLLRQGTSFVCQA